MSSSNEIKLGAVSYLNARPLLETLPFSIYKDVPARLINSFTNSEVDAALLSMYDILQLPQAEVVDNIGIGCRGDVYSVILAYEGALKNIKKIQLDSSSHTSNKLLKIILAEFYHLYPEYIEGDFSGDESLPRLIIGDPAMSFREKASCAILDLGGEWYRFTQLPFVFAMWCMNKKSLRKKNLEKKYLSHHLLAAKEQGLRQREAIAATQPNPALALRYLTEYIRYDVGDEERRGVALFQSLLKKYSL